jgi:hypothetical protein
MIRHYDFGMTKNEAKSIDGKVVTVSTASDAMIGEPERYFSRVRTMLTGHILLLLADGEPGPPDQVYIDLIRTVEVHDS